MGPPGDSPPGPLAQTYGTPPDDAPLEDAVQHMATLTVPLELVPQLAALVQAHEQQQREQREADAGNVVLLDRHRGAAR